MATTELATLDCLRILLQQQLGGLTATRGRAEQAIRRHAVQPPPAEWQGDARRAYDTLARELDAELRRIERCLGEGISHTGRALATVGDRVG